MCFTYVGTLVKHWGYNIEFMTSCTYSMQEHAYPLKQVSKRSILYSFASSKIASL